MNKLYRIIIFLLMVGFAACASTPSNMAVADNDEDKDIGLGGTGLLANAGGGAGSGLGGTGVVGEITGFGVFSSTVLKLNTTTKRLLP